MHKPPLKTQKRKEFWAESSMVKGPWESHGARLNKSHYLFLCYQFLGVFTPETKYMEIVRGIGGAPGT